MAVLLALPSFALGQDCNQNGIDDGIEAGSNGLVGYYFNNPTWTGGYSVARIDATVDFPYGSPGFPPPSLPADDFGVRWMGTLLSNAAGTYRLSVEHDDGFRLYFNGVLLPWMIDDGVTTNSVDVELTANTKYHIRLDFFDNSGEQQCILRWRQPGGSLEVLPSSNLFPISDRNANGVPDECEFGDCNLNGISDTDDITSGWSTDCDANGRPDECEMSCGDCDGNGILDVCEPSLPTNGMVGQYWISYGGAGTYSDLFLVRVDPDVNFDWGSGAPATGMTADNFAVRWTGTITTPDAAGTYTFYTKTNDGVRLWVNGQLLVDQWHSSPSVEYSGTITLAAATRYSLRMDYFELTGSARAWLYWQPPGQTKVIVPTSALRPASDVNADGYPDGCADCNGNGVPDSVDISSGTDQDCDQNCVPDSCDMTQPPPIAYWRFEEAAGEILDSGPHALNGTLNSLPYRTSNVPASPVPQNGLTNGQSLSMGWASASNGGFFTVPDAGGALTLGDRSFTIEAWVKLDHLSDTSSNDERQFLCQKKVLPSADATLDYAVLVQRGNNSPGTTYGKTSGFSGRELQIYFGTGTANWNVTSNLQIADLNWHFVSVAYDADGNTVRFGLDGAFETVAFGAETRTTNAGPLRVGSHQNSSGVDNFFLRGALDELRISDGLLAPTQLLNSPNAFDCNGNQIYDACDLADGTSQDCNHNGIPDECDLLTMDCNANGVVDICDIAQGDSPDCNANGIPDECELPPLGNDTDCDQNGILDSCEFIDCNQNGVFDGCDIANGTSQDCNDDAIPDDCQLYGGEYIYLCEDTAYEYGLRSAGTCLAWLNRYVVTGDALVVDGIDLTYVNIVDGAPAMVYLWSDPNGDGEPADAQVLASAPTTTVNAPGSVFRVNLPPTVVGGNGTSFFVGTILAYPDASSYPCPLDATAPSELGVSWIIGRDGPIDPNDLSNSHLEYNLTENCLPWPANVPVRAVARMAVNDCNTNGVPDSCDLAAGTSQDVNNNGLPDECEDCNENGMPDEMDIADGTSQDCQPDGTPDECQLADHDCNSDQIPDECQLVGNDCNNNGVPDSCDLAGGSSTDLNNNGLPDECEDCNDNGMPDDLDIADGTSQDCQSDGVPDDCQLGEPAYETYLLDDGTLEANLGLGAPGDTAWLNHFTVTSGMEVIAYVEIVYTASLFEGMPVTVYVWLDPNGDGNPSDAWVIASVNSTVVNSGQTVFNPVYVGDTYIGPVGTSFFVGAMIHDDTNGTYPITRDTNNVRDESWYAARRSPGVLDPNYLGGAEYFGRLAGNTMIRARAFSGIYPDDCNQNLVPDECDLANGTLTDLDGNGIPDACDVDCNSNGVPDFCDITCAGGCAGFGGCGQSADCDGNDLPDECDLLEHDCNWNGIPDACDVPPLGSYSPDCNGDLIPDECQLADDCNGNGVPDDCDLGGTPVPQYVLDDGTAEDALGLTGGGAIAWLNRFVVLTGGESIKGIRIAYGYVATGKPVTIYVWNDPDGNGNPADAQVLVFVETTVQDPDTDIMNYVQFPATHIGAAGTSFFVGAVMPHVAGERPAALDQNIDERESWIAGGAAGVDPDNLSGSAVFGRIRDFGFPGNWLIRAVSTAPPPPNDCNANGVPDECDIANGTSQDVDGNGIPDECVEAGCALLGDFNGNLLVNGLDIQGFVDCILGGDNCPCADVNGDGQADIQDIPAFVTKLLTP